MSADPEFVPPQDLQAERAILGAVMLSNDLMDAVAEIVAPVDFYRRAHACVFEQAMKLHQRKEPIDFLTLKSALTLSGDLAEVGPSYLLSLIDGVPRSTNVEAYAHIVRECATKRDLVKAANVMLREAYGGEDEASALLDRAQQALLGVATQRTGGGFVPIPDIISGEVMPLIERFCSEKRVVSGVPTGLIDLDYLTRGFQPSDLVIIAARPSMGKTALVLSAAVYASTVGKQHVGVFSLEMSRMQLGLRALIGEARIDGMRLQSGRVYEEEWSRLSAAVETVSAALLHIDDTPQVTVHEIRARARRLKALVGLDLIIVDYIQLMKASSKGENRNLELGEISGSLKAIAKDLKLPVIALSQLSRACEGRADKRPMLSDLRDSGALEADADVVIFIYRDEVYNKGTEDQGVAELSVAKNRNGPIGGVKVGFEKHHTRFFNLHAEDTGRVVA